MSLSRSLANRIREVILNGQWIANTNFKDQIGNINYQEAVYKIADLNTIAMLTFHVNYYVKGVLQVFKGGRLDIKDKNSFNLPEIKSEADWQNLVNDLFTNAEMFADLVEEMDDDFLMQPFFDEKYGSNQRNIEAIIEHSYYHLAQVVLIRKMIRGSIKTGL